MWEEIRRAFEEGRDAEEKGAPVAPLLDLMMLAARADRVIDDAELLRIANLLHKHWRALRNISDKEVLTSVQASLARLDTMGNAQQQLKTACDRVRSHGERACEEGYSLAYAVLLAGGIDDKERTFAAALCQALDLDAARAQAIEATLDQAAGHK